MLYLISRATFLRLVRAAEASLLGLRVRTFEHIHRLSLADHVDQRRGALVSRVTSDVETMAQFTEWGAVAWIVDTVLIVGTLAVMLVYSWQLALVASLVFLPLLPALALPAAPPARRLRRRPHRGRRHALGGVRAGDRRAGRPGLRAAAPEPARASTTPSPPSTGRRWARRSGSR